jgi:hypothetical protein
MKRTLSTPPSLCDAERQASNCGLDISKLRALLEKIEPLSDKYKEIFYRAATGLYSADDLAEMFNHSSGKNLNADFNKNLGSHLKDYLELDERVGITSLRRVLFKKGYFVDINDDESVRVLPTRYAENSQTELNDDESVRVLPTRYAENSQTEQSFTVIHN